MKFFEALQQISNQKSDYFLGYIGEPSDTESSIKGKSDAENFYSYGKSFPTNKPSDITGIKENFYKNLSKIYNDAVDDLFGTNFTVPKEIKQYVTKPTIKAICLKDAVNEIYEFVFIHGQDLGIEGATHLLSSRILRSMEEILKVATKEEETWKKRLKELKKNPPKTRLEKLFAKNGVWYTSGDRYEDEIIDARKKLKLASQKRNSAEIAHSAIDKRQARLPFGI